MNVLYRYYEPNQDLEEVQALIYSSASGLSANVESIKARYKDRKKDPKTTLYAFTEDGEPLAYVQATDSTSSPGRTHISYPWALLNCPSQVQEKLFDELLNYLLQKKEILEITSPIRRDSKNIEGKITFFLNKGFIDKEHLYFYDYNFDVTSVSKMDIPNESRSFSIHFAKESDIENLIDLCQSDPNYQYFTPDVATSFFGDHLRRKNKIILVYQDDLLLAAGLFFTMKAEDLIYSTGGGEKVVLRVSPVRTGYPHAWKRLLIAIANECIAIGWDDIPLNIYFRFYASSTIAINLAKILPEIVDFEYIFAYKRSGHHK